MLCRYRRVLLEQLEGCGGTEEYTRRPGEAVLVQQSTIGTLWTLCWYNRALQEHRGCCAGIAEYYRSTLETVLLQQTTIETIKMPWEALPVQLSTNGALGHCAGREEYYRSTVEAVLVQHSTIGALGGAVRVYQSAIGTLWNLSWYCRILKEHSQGILSRTEYYRSAREAVLVQHSTMRALRRLCW